MARTFTLAELRTELRLRGDYEDSGVFTDATLTAWVNDAIAEVYELVDQACENYFVTETSLTTTANSDTVSLPATFYKLVGLDFLDGNIYRRLGAHDIQARTRYGTLAGQPRSYRLQGGALRLLPTPDAAYTLRLLYIPAAPKLSADGDTFDGINGFESLVVQKALLLCDMREERPLGDRMAIIQKLEDRVRTAVSARDAGEPHWLGRRVDPDDEEPGLWR